MPVVQGNREGELMHNVFVYGTLKRGQIREHVLHHQRYLGEAATDDGYRLFDCGDYPALIVDPTATRQVRGEVWSVDSACLTELDHIECVEDDLYTRKRIRLRTPFADQLVESYFYQLPTEGLMDCGEAWPIT